MLTTENEIMTTLRVNPESALKVLYDKYYDLLAYTSYKLIKDSAIAEDVVQEVFFEIWKKRESINITTSIKAYLKRATINKTLNHIRAKKMVFEDEDAVFDLQDHQHTTHASLEAEEMEQKINRAIDKLPERCRCVFALSRYEELSYREIAEKLDISIKTVENQIAKALKVLRAEIYGNLEKV